MIHPACGRYNHNTSTRRQPSIYWHAQLMMYPFGFEPKFLPYEGGSVLDRVLGVTQSLDDGYKLGEVGIKGGRKNPLSYLLGYNDRGKYTTTQ